MVLAAGFGQAGAFGPNALRSIEAMRRELTRTRKRGYGVAVEEAEPGVVGIALTICGESGVPQGVLAIAGPTVRMTPERIIELAAMARLAADELAVVWPLRMLAPSAVAHPRAVA